MPHRHIRVNDGTQFHEQMAAFSFEMFLTHGRGAVIVREEHFHKRRSGRIQARLEWVNQDTAEAFPVLKELASMVSGYDPIIEFVFVTLDNDNRGDPMVLQTAEGGVTPRDAYERDRALRFIDQWKAGCIVRLEEVVNGIEPGWFVFLGRDDATFRVCRAGEDEDGNICRSEEERDIHVDFSECFRFLDFQTGAP